MDFGILPIQNSTAGSVTQTYEIMAQYDFLRNQWYVEIKHVIAVKKGVKMSDVTEVYSHPHALTNVPAHLKRTWTNPCFIYKHRWRRSLSQKVNSQLLLSARRNAQNFIWPEVISSMYLMLIRMLLVSYAFLKNFSSAKRSSTIAVSLRFPNTCCLLIGF